MPYHNLKDMSGIERLKYYCSNCGEMTRSKKKVHILVALLVNIINFAKPFCNYKR